MAHQIFTSKVIGDETLASEAYISTLNLSKSHRKWSLFTKILKILFIESNKCVPKVNKNAPDVSSAKK